MGTKSSFLPEGTERQREAGQKKKAALGLIPSVPKGSQVGMDRFMGVAAAAPGRLWNARRLAVLFINLEKSGKGLLVVKKMKMFRKGEEKNLKPFHACPHVRGRAAPPVPTCHRFPSWQRGQEPGLEHISHRFLNL